MDPIERYRGSLLGLAVGDALGVSVEGLPAASFDPVDDLFGGGAFELEPGQWTDDTSMALCLAESLTDLGGFDLVDQLERYCMWYRRGRLSSNGRCFDIGVQNRESLGRYEMTGEAHCGPEHPLTAGNGSLMRLAPVPLFYARDPAVAIEHAGESSRSTHGAAEAVDACRFLAALILGALQGLDREELLEKTYEPVAELWTREPLAPRIRDVAAGSYKKRNPPDIRGSSYVVDCLEAALWALYNSDNFRDGALLAVNLGDEAGSTGAVFGQLAGALYGENGIPVNWLGLLAKRSLIEELADELYFQSKDLSTAEQHFGDSAELGTEADALEEDAHQGPRSTHHGSPQKWTTPHGHAPQRANPVEHDLQTPTGQRPPPAPLGQGAEELDGDTVTYFNSDTRDLFPAEPYAGSVTPPSADDGEYEYDSEYEYAGGLEAEASDESGEYEDEDEEPLEYEEEDIDSEDYEDVEEDSEFYEEGYDEENSTPILYDGDEEEDDTAILDDEDENDETLLIPTGAGRLSEHDAHGGLKRPGQREDSHRRITRTDAPQAKADRPRRDPRQRPDDDSDVTDETVDYTDDTVDYGSGASKLGRN